MAVNKKQARMSIHPKWGRWGRRGSRERRQEAVSAVYKPVLALNSHSLPSQ